MKRKSNFIHKISKVENKPLYCKMPKYSVPNTIIDLLFITIF